MNGWLSLFRMVNLRHLLERRVRTALTVSGIAAGVALVFSISVINETLLSSFRSSMRSIAGAAEIEVAAAEDAGLPAAAVERVEAISGVERAVPVTRSLSRTQGPRGARRALFLGVTFEFAGLFPSDVGPLGELRVSGGFGASGRAALLSEGLADAIGASTGQRVSVETPRGRARVDVGGMLRGGALALVNGGDVAVMMLPAAQETFAKRGRVDSVYVVVDPAVPIAAVESSIDDALGGSAVVGPPGERGRGLERVFGSLSTLLSLAGTVALFVALFVVYNTMSMSLAERRRELSMALALGSSARQLFVAFLAEAAVLGSIASAAGIAFGSLLARVLIERAAEGYRILPVGGTGPIVVDGSDVALAAAGGMLVSLVGALLPARRVSSLAPIESMRPQGVYESGGSALARRRALTALAGVSLTLAAGSFPVYVYLPEERWLVTFGIVLTMAGVSLLLPMIVPTAVGWLAPLLRGGFGMVGRLASDSLAKNPRRTTFTVAALVLTLGMVIGVGSALASYSAQVESTVGSLIGAPLYVVSESYTGLTSDQPLSGDLRDELAGVPGVEYVYPLRFSLVSIGGEQGLLLAIPVEEAIERGATSRPEAIADDPHAFVTGLSRGDIAVSRLTARRHDVDVGDSLALPTPTGKRRFTVAALFDDLNTLDSVYIHHRTYRRFWNDDKADEFGVLLEDGASRREVEEGLEGVIRRERAAARVLTREESVGRVLELIEGTFSLGRGIQLAALVVALLTIANTMFTTVLERRWEMGLQRALGMGGRQLRGEILLEAAGIGLLGGLGGALLGTVTGYVMTVTMEIQYAWRIAFRPPVSLAVAAIAAGIAVALLAGAWPSRRVARTTIMESLRYE